MTSFIIGAVAGIILTVLIVMLVGICRASSREDKTMKKLYKEVKNGQS